MVLKRTALEILFFFFFGSKYRNLLSLIGIGKTISAVRYFSNLCKSKYLLRPSQEKKKKSHIEAQLVGFLHILLAGCEFYDQKL